MGMYASSNGNGRTGPGDFDWFEYRVQARGRTERWDKMLLPSLGPMGGKPCPQKLYRKMYCAEAKSSGRASRPTLQAWRHGEILSFVSHILLHNHIGWSIVIR